MPTKPKDTPDAAVWTDHGRTFFLCARCITTEEVTGRDARNGGYRAAIAHLWRSHSLRKVWIDEKQPNLDPASQLAFDLAIQHQRHF